MQQHVHANAAPGSAASSDLVPLKVHVPSATVAGNLVFLSSWRVQPGVALTASTVVCMVHVVPLARVTAHVGTETLRKRQKELLDGQWVFDTPLLTSWSAPMCAYPAAESLGKCVELIARQPGSLLPPSLVIGQAEKCKHEQLFRMVCMQCNVSFVDEPQPKLLERYVYSHEHRDYLVLKDHAARKSEASRAQALSEQRRLFLVLDIDHTMLHVEQVGYPPNTPRSHWVSTRYNRALEEHFPNWNSLDDDTRREMQLHEFAVLSSSTITPNVRSVKHSNVSPSTAAPSANVPPPASADTEDANSAPPPEATVTATAPPSDDSNDLTPSGVTMVVKLRPHLLQFLRELTKLYRLFIYTKGSRPYANAIARLLDPDHVYFASRVISRDDCPEGAQKSLVRLFPANHDLVLVVDDSPEVWEDTGHVIPVSKYVFWPLTKDMAVRRYEEVVRVVDWAANRAIHHAAAAAAASSKGQTEGAGQQSSKLGAQRAHRLLNSNPLEDGDLPVVQKILQSVHSDFFAAASDSNTHVVELLKKIQFPKLGDFLQDCVILFTGLIGKADKEPERSMWWQIAESCGARCVNDLTPEVTHVVARFSGTEKAKEGIRRIGIFVVRNQWLLKCQDTFSRMPELPFTIHARDSDDPVDILDRLLPQRAERRPSQDATDVLDDDDDADSRSDNQILKSELCDGHRGLVEDLRWAMDSLNSAAEFVKELKLQHGLNDLARAPGHLLKDDDIDHSGRQSAKDHDEDLFLETDPEEREAARQKRVAARVERGSRKRRRHQISDSSDEAASNSDEIDERVQRRFSGMHDLQRNMNDDADESDDYDPFDHVPRGEDDDDDDEDMGREDEDS